MYNPEPFRQKARDNFKLDDKQLNKEVAANMINTFCFTDRVLKVVLKITMESHHNNHAFSKLFFKPNYPEFGIEVRYIVKIKKKLSVIHARLKNQ